MGSACGFPSWSPNSSEGIFPATLCPQLSLNQSLWEANTGNPEVKPSHSCSECQVKHSVLSLNGTQPYTLFRDVVGTCAGIPVLLLSVERLLLEQNPHTVSAYHNHHQPSPLPPFSLGPYGTSRAHFACAKLGTFSHNPWAMSQRESPDCFIPFSVL